MGCLGVYFALTDEDLRKVLDAATDEDRRAIITDDIEDRWNEEWLFSTDQAWGGIHRCLSDGTLDNMKGEYPLKLAVLGGQHLYGADDYIIVLIAPDEAGDLAEALAGIEEGWLRSRYESHRFPDYGLEKCEDDFAYIWSYFEGLKRFIRKAADARRSVLFTAGQ